MFSIVVLVIISVVTLMYVRGSGPLDGYAAKVSFPVYYPTKLPPGYTLNPKSVSISSDLLFFSVTSAEKKPTLVFTEQSMPANFDIKSMVGKDATALAVESGTFYDIGTDKQNKYILATDSTLIFINITDKIDASAVNFMAGSMHQVR